MALSLSEESVDTLTDSYTGGNEFVNENINMQTNEPLYEGALHSVFTSYVSIMLSRK